MLLALLSILTMAWRLIEILLSAMLVFRSPAMLVFLPTMLVFLSTGDAGSGDGGSWAEMATMVLCG